MTKNKLLLLLALLLTAATGAWAQVFRLPTVRQMENSRQLSITDMPKRANGLLRAPVQDSHGIITTPDEGVTKYYTRAGTGYYTSNGSVYNEDQSGIVTILEAEGGKVYIKDPVSHYNQNTWVVGTKAGNTITVAAAQPLFWNTNYSATLSLNWGNVQSTNTGNTYVRGEGDITFTVDDQAGTITLNGSSSDKIIAVFWDDDNSWSGYGDHGTVWTHDPNYQPASTDPIVLPDGAEVQNWYADGTGSSAVPTDVKVAFVGNEVYISGLTSNFPDAWIKGTLDGTTVTFSKFQFVGMYNSTMPIWAVGADPNTGKLQDFTMTYNSEAQTLTLDANQLLVFNAAENRMYYLNYIETLTISAEEPVPAVIETLPYVNSFDTAADQKQFTIIDANEDGRTWNWYSGQGRYTYSQTNAGNDWLVSPAIKLVAGKKYAFSIDAHAQSGTYPERLEVKMAKEGTAAALAAGAQLIEPTVITSASFITLSNSEFTVAETGEYYIGVHAISDQNQYYLYVDNFKVDMLVPPTYSVTLADGTEDAGNWTISPASAAEGETVTVTYTGTKRLIGFKAEKKASGTPLTTPLTIEAITPGTIVVDMNATLQTGMKYSVNGGTKTLITTTTSIEGLKAGDKVQFYGNGTQTQVYGGDIEVKIKGSGDGFKTKVYGNIMSLLDEDNFATKTDLPDAQYVFYELFTENTTLIDASELLLPATTLAPQCYYGMFNGCTSLTTAPKLPATTLTTQCYYAMFFSCTSLTNAYVKAAFTDSSNECDNMFGSCSAAGAVLHTTPGNKASWETKMGLDKDWETWTVADDWQE